MRTRGDRDVYPVATHTITPGSSLITPLTTPLSASSVAAAMVSELRIHAAANDVELFVQTLVLKTIPILDSELVTRLHEDPTGIMAVFSAASVRVPENSYYHPEPIDSTFC
ncbi:hypothetical protein TNCV_4821291 [Trichonephila clavipes]|nr:hypothetical protein TNCV_4821291 [Trichonephila clavipes]